MLTVTMKSGRYELSTYGGARVEIWDDADEDHPVDRATQMTERIVKEYLGIE